MPFNDLIKKTTITITDKKGKKQTSQGQIQNNTIYIYDKNVIIDNGYIIDFTLSNGLKKTVIVVDPGYYGDAVMHHPGFPIYQTKVQDIEEYEQKQKNSLPNINITNQNGSVVVGNVTNSNITINTSISELEKEINERGGEDKEELLDLLEQVKELCENIKTSNSLPKSKTLMKKISEHFTKHSWFYNQVVQIIGSVVIKIMLGE